MKGHSSPTSVHKQAKPGVPPDKSGKNLFHRTVRGGFWVFALRIFTQILSFARYIILANILAVADSIEDIGLLGVAMLMMQALNTFSQTGFQAALIQKRDNVQAHLDTVWTIGLFRAVVLYAILYWGASFAELPIFKVPPEKVFLTISIIRVLGISFLLSALSNIGVIYFQKEMEFNRQFALQIVANLSNVVVTIFVVLVYRSVWALVIGKLVGELARLLLSYVFHPYRPRIRLDFDKARELWRFGKWIFGGSIIGFIMTQGDNFFVWGYMGVFALALYQMAFKLSNIPTTEIAHVISQVTFPALSKIQDDIPRLKDAYLKILQVSAFLSVPLAGLIIILTPDFVALFLNEKWEPIIPVMQILALRSMIVSTGATRGPLFKAVGKPGIKTKLQVLRLILLAILIYPMTTAWGIKGTAGAITLVIAIAEPFAIYLGLKIIHCRIGEILKLIALPVAATGAMLGLIYLFKQSFFYETTYANLFILAVIGICTYITVAYVFDSIFDYRIKKIIREQLAVLTRQKNTN
jgi:lipopolysaccharide exporter